MHNDTPFGMTMYLKELDRQAAPKSSALRSEAQRSRRGTTFRDSSVALLRRVGAIVSGTTSMGAPNSRRSPQTRCPQLEAVQVSHRTTIRQLHSGQVVMGE